MDGRPRQNHRRRQTRAPSVRFHPLEYCDTAGDLDPLKIFSLFDKGATIIIYEAHRYFSQLASACRSAEIGFRFPFQANIYITPQGEQSLDVHYDTHDVFALQIHGSKNWTLYPPIVEWPTHAHPFDRHVHKMDLPLKEFTLETGDLLYCPRGTPHAAVAKEGTSIHVAFSALSYTWADALHAAIDVMVDQNAALRKSLPPSILGRKENLSDAEVTFQNLLTDFCSNSSLKSTVARIDEKFVLGRPQFVPTLGSQLLAASSLNIESRVGARPGVIYRLRDSESEEIQLLLPWTTITFPGRAKSELTYALETSFFRVGDLPGILAAGEKVQLAIELMKNGVLISCHPTDR